MERYIQGFGGGGPDGKILHGKPRRRWEDNIKMDIKEMRWGARTGFIIPVQRRMAGFCESSKEPSGSIKCGENLD